MKPVIATLITFFFLSHLIAQDTSQIKKLKAIEVTAKRPLLEQSIDKTIVNVDAMISSASSNTLEVLSKTPGVTVDQNGNINLNGKGVLVLINGRTTYMSGQDLANYLKSLPGSTLDKIELMDAPPAKYDASGNGVINLRMKKSTILGLTGNLTLSGNQGIYTRSNNSINLNYNHKKMNWFGGVFYNRDADYDLNRDDRKYYTVKDSLTSSVHLHTLGRPTSHSEGVKVGMDFQATPKTTYGFEMTGILRPSVARQDYTSSTMAPDGTIDSVNTGYTHGKGHWRNFNGNVNMLHKFNDKGREISADASYISYLSHDKQQLANPDPFYYDLQSDMRIYAIKTDYVHPLKKNASIEAGLKSSFVTNDYDSKYFNSEKLGVDSNSNHFIYHENINGAYISARKKWNRWGAQLGVRVENTNLSGRQPGNSAIAPSLFKRSYTQAFPTAYLSYQMDSAGNHTLMANFGRRLDRPNYQQLNPFVAFDNDYSLRTGNPSLRPQTNYRTELKYQYKQWLSFTAQYSWFKDVIFTMADVENNIYVYKPQNVASGYIAMIIANVSWSPVRWMNNNINALTGKMQLHGTAFDQSLNPGLYSYRIRGNHQFDIPHGWGAEVIWDISGPDVSGQSINNRNFLMFAAVQKKLWHNKASIKLNVDDIFHTAARSNYSTGLKQSTATHWGTYDAQRVGLAFNWRFGADTFGRKRNHNDNTADEEKGRAN